MLINSIERLLPKDDKTLTTNLFKLPHHGSKANISNDLIARVDCPAFVFSTDGTQFKHPDDVAVARVIHTAPSPQLVFNYVTAFNRVWANPDLQKQYGYTARYPDDEQEGVVVEL